MATIYVDAGMNSYGGQTTYALRAAFVPDTTDPNVIIDLRVIEPGGTAVSTITPYNTALGSQLFATGKLGPGPRVYMLPSMEKGDFDVTITFEGPDEHGPLHGYLYLHRQPRPFVEVWERHDVLLQRAGDRFSLTFPVDGPALSEVSTPRP